MQAFDSRSGSQPNLAGSASALPDRSLSQDPFRWNLDQYWPSVGCQNFEEAIKKGETLSYQFGKEWSGANRAAVTPAELQKILEHYDEVCSLRAALRLYPTLCKISNEEKRLETLEARSNGCVTSLAEAAGKFSAWWRELPQADAERFLSSEEIIPFREHLSSERRVAGTDIIEANKRSEFLVQARTIFNQIKFHLNAEEVKLVELERRYDNPDPVVRAGAYEAVLAGLAPKASEMEAAWQGYGRNINTNFCNAAEKINPTHIRALQDGFPTAVIDSVIATYPEFCNAFQEYFRMKQQLLSLDKMSRYDVLAPTAKPLSITADEGLKNVAEALSEFSPELAETVKMLFLSGRIHLAQSKEGTRTYHGTPKTGCYFACNNADSLNGMYDLMQEFCHAIALERSRNQSYSSYTSSTFVQKSLCIFGELLLTDHLLKANARAKDNGTKLTIVGNQLDRLYRGTVRALGMACFERDIALNPDMDLSKGWLAMVREQLKDAVEVPDSFASEWVRMWPYFLQQPNQLLVYPVGFTIGITMYEQHKTGTLDPNKLLKMLDLGGSKSSDELLQVLNIKLNEDSCKTAVGSVIEDLTEKLRGLSIDGLASSIHLPLPF